MIDETLLYALFGCCVVLLGICGIILYGNYQWKRSRQRAQEQYIVFWNHLENDLKIDYHTIMEVCGQMKYISDYEKSNRRLKKVSHESQLQHK